MKPRLNQKLHKILNYTVISAAAAMPALTAAANAPAALVAGMIGNAFFLILAYFLLKGLIRNTQFFQVTIKIILACLATVGFGIYAMAEEL